MNIPNNIILTPPEQEIAQSLIEIYDCSEQTAINEVIKYKRELALYHQQCGNFALAKMILTQINEWDESREEDFKNSQLPSKRKILLPGDTK